ncbi:deoxyhypusine hydroxylase-like isoform X2 [Artemia franciscana]|uniref:Deoxyhypusine hydroxylase n=2 Tax=Artemia franciscana TaxID=6661 RepID=A0AA88ICZ0_ARTSF|nr:hypothetical protein QYM36_001376 [Artemia franciscana]KAK2724885.1 hypothetical protein QYM36_001376 [Artemia franciscana]KAK2724886.1 hypothetical protein QYM36_001376 [Artemia franciscana]KAK2724887.1 hypothetical protein QYM36_001376 [Artemia franciscana]
MGNQTQFSNQQVVDIGSVLNNPERPLKERFRALFTLKNIGGLTAVKEIANCFKDESALLKHELAYCLGQMQDNRAVPYLEAVLKDVHQEAMVRHEAGEALGAIGDEAALPVLESYVNDPIVEVAETCQLSVERIKWLKSKNEEKVSSNPYSSVDPAPPCPDRSPEELRATLLNEELPLFERYRAMFALRNKGDDQSILALGNGLQCKGALFRHEIAYVLGQIQSPLVIQQLRERLELPEESEMVRHECAEALGSIAAPECRQILEAYLKDEARVVKESCEVALDICEYENSPEFQYTASLV